MKPIFHRPPGTITFRSSIHCCGRLSSFIHCRSIGEPSSAFILLLFNRPASPRSFVVVQSFGSWQANLTTHALHISGATQLIAHLAVSVFRHIWMIDGCDRVDDGGSFSGELNPLFASVRQRVSHGWDDFHDDTRTSLYIVCKLDVNLHAG
eukprot:scaffold58164_cov43-Cyclotella_meneghiniana.AAC.4